MTEQPYPPLRRQPPVRRRRQPSPWPMIIGVAILAILTVALAIIVLGGDEDPGAAASGSPGASAAPTDATGASPSAGASASAGASGAPTAITRDSIVATTVEGLSVRAGAAPDAERLGLLELGATSFVADGPVEAGGHTWYLVSGLGLPPNTGCAGPVETDPFNCPTWFGWVAGTSETGEPWLTPQAPACPPQPLTAEGLFLARTDLERLACFGSEPITFRAWWPEIPDDAGLGGACEEQAEPSGWLVCQNINYNGVTISEAEGFGGVGGRVSIDPATGLSMPERGTWVELRVHFDDPAAQGCDEAIADTPAPQYSPEQQVLVCRGQMVLEAVQAVDGP